jgi:hypothetical protein
LAQSGYPNRQSKRIFLEEVGLEASASSLLSTEGQILLELIEDEFSRTNVHNWGYFFPILIATWRFIWYVRPGFLGAVVYAKYEHRSPPSFKGKNAAWFVEMLVDNNEYQDLVEPLWYQIAEGITPTVRDREMMRKEEIPKLDTIRVEQLAQLILARVDHAFRGGQLP